MPGFDAELYLRRLGEDALLGNTESRNGDFPELNDAAATLVAVAAIELECAYAVLSDYAAASVARGGFSGYLYRHPHAVTAQRPAARRMVALGDELELPKGVLRLRHVTLDEDRTEISAVYTAGAGSGAHTSWIRNPSGYPSGLAAPTLTDDQGTTTTLDFSGGGNDDRWEATLTAGRPIAPDTSWIELYGHRIPLRNRSVEATVEIEPLPPVTPAHRHLWRCVALGLDHFAGSELIRVVDAMVAAGTLDADDPEIELAQQVRHAIPRQHGPRGTTSVANAPEPWPSLVRRAGRSDGPEGMVVVGAVTPEFERHFVAVYCLESGADAFTIEAAVSPPDTEPHPGNVDLEQHTLIWWARDDRGNHYLGGWHGSGGDEKVKSGTLAFVPALDPRATRLEVLPTALAERAVIGFPLTWVEGRS